MKNFFSIIFILSFSVIIAQDYAFKINPLSLAYEGVEVSIENKAISNTSAEVVFGYTSTKLKNIDGKLKAFAGELRYKFLLTPKSSSLEGGYIAPTGSFITGKITENNILRTHDIKVLSLGLIGGYEFVFQNDKNNGFALDLNLGFINYFAKSYSVDVSDIKGIKPRFGIGLGYAF